MNESRRAVSAAQIGPEQAGRRLDNVLLSLLKGAPRSLVYKLLRSGQVRVNGGRAKPDYRVVTGDRLRIPPLSQPARETGIIPDSRRRQIESAVLFETADWLVINKPAGLSCHAGSGQAYGVIEVARAIRPDEARLDLGHRLDRETSGCLVLSKSLPALQRLHVALRERSSEKYYVALVRGSPAADLARIDAPLDIARDQHGERRAAVDAAGKPASTVIMERTACGADTLLKLRLETGRMHQIRAHARHCGMPVAGDREYGDPKFNRRLRALGLKRLFLHASRIVFDAGNGGFDVSAPLPPELARVVERLESRSV